MNYPKLIIIGATFIIGLLFVAPLPAGAINCPETNGSKGQVLTGIDQAGTECGNGESQVNSVARSILNLISFLAGIISVIVLIISGIKYVTSGGDSAKVNSAKSALVYALIGLVVVALAQTLFKLVINTASDILK